MEVYVVLLVRILDCISFIMLLPVSGIELERIFFFPKIQIPLNRWEP